MLALVSLLALGVAAACVPVKPAPTTITFLCTEDAQAWTVPAGVTTAFVEVAGAAGGSFVDGDTTIPGGRGGGATASFAVTPGETIGIHVGCAGESTGAADPIAGEGGFNGGASGFVRITFWRS